MVYIGYPKTILHNILITFDKEFKFSLSHVIQFNL